MVLTIFWSGTVVSELFFDWETVHTVKTLILAGVPVLVLCLMIAGVSGARLGSTSVLVRRKLARLRAAAANGVLCLVPCAVVLWWLSAREGPHMSFYAVQTVELAAGAFNLVLIGLNVRDGLRLKTSRIAIRPEPRGLSEA